VRRSVVVLLAQHSLHLITPNPGGESADRLGVGMPARRLFDDVEHSGDHAQQVRALRW
jgi:hypothetical protein